MPVYVVIITIHAFMAEGRKANSQGLQRLAQEGNVLFSCVETVPRKLKRTYITGSKLMCFDPSAKKTQ